MIKEFKIFERLGYNDEVSKLAEYIWKLYKQGEKVIDLSEYSKDNMTIFVNKIFINEYKDKENNTRMSVLFDNVYYKKTKNFKIKINKSSKPTIMTLEHELKHMYDFIKRGGDYLKIKDKNFIAPFNSMISEEDENLKIFFHIMYIIEMSEIEAFYHGDMRNFKENKHKYKNNIRTFIKYSRLKNNLDFLNEYNITKLLSKIDRNEKNNIINLYHKIKKEKEKFMNLDGFKYKVETFKDKIKEFLVNMDILSDNYIEYTNEEINLFYYQFEKEIEKKKKVYLKYIGRLFAYFN